MNNKKMIDNIYSESMAFFHILSNTIDHARKNNTVQDLTTIMEKSKSIELQTSKIDTYLSSLLSKHQDLKKSSESLFKLYTEYKELHTSLGKFSKEVNALISQLDTMEDFGFQSSYKDRSLMNEIRSFINNCNKFMKDYNGLVNELNRRSEIHDRNEKISLIIQKELDLLATREQKERLNFEERFSISKEALPDVWNYPQLFRNDPEIVYKVIRE